MRLSAGVATLERLVVTAWKTQVKYSIHWRLSADIVTPLDTICSYVYA